MLVAVHCFHCFLTIWMLAYKTFPNVTLGHAYSRPRTDVTTSLCISILAYFSKYGIHTVTRAAVRPAIVQVLLRKSHPIISEKRKLQHLKKNTPKINLFFFSTKSILYSVNYLIVTIIHLFCCSIRISGLRT